MAIRVTVGLVVIPVIAEVRAMAGTAAAMDLGALEARFREQPIAATVPPVIPVPVRAVALLAGLVGRGV